MGGTSSFAGYWRALSTTLVWRVVPWVLFTMLGLQAVLCIPWIQREKSAEYEDDEARIVRILRASAGPGALAETARRAPDLRGATLYEGGVPVAVVGVEPTMAPGDGGRAFADDGSYQTALAVDDAVLVVRLDGRRANERLREFVVDLFTVLVPAALFSTLTTLLLLVGSVVMPLRALQSDLEARAPDLAALVHGPGADEVDRVRRLVAELDDARRAADQASHARSTFFTSMTHELRTPLHAIVGYCEVVEPDLDDSGLAGPASDIRKIRGNASRLLGIINDVLTVAKLEAGELKVELADLEVAPILADLATAVEPLVSRGGNVLRIDAAAGLPRVHADASLVRHCLINLVANAAKFTKDGEIAVEVRCSAAEIAFVVRDTGCGIASAELARIFEPYQQAQSTAKHVFGGVGLGLTIVRSCCERMGGRVEVQSTLGVGSVFTVRLPSA
jgi:signal transduction histidine kinase